MTEREYPEYLERDEPDPEDYESDLSQSYQDFKDGLTDEDGNRLEDVEVTGLESIKQALEEIPEVTWETLITKTK